MNKTTRLIFSSLIAGCMCMCTAFLALPVDVEISTRTILTIIAGGMLQACKDVHAFLREGV